MHFRFTKSTPLSIFKKIAFLLLLMLIGCGDPQPDIPIQNIQNIQNIVDLKSGETLRVGFIPTPGLFFPDNKLDTGIDYELVKHFAESTNKMLIPVQVTNSKQLIQYLKQDKIDLALPGSGFSINDPSILKSQIYRKTDWYVIYNQKNAKPKKLVINRKPIVLKDSNADMVLSSLKTKNENLSWQFSPHVSTITLLDDIERNRSGYTILDNDSFIYYRRLFPNLKRSFSLKPPQNNVWLCIDQTLLEQINHYFTDKNTSEFQTSLVRHYQGHLSTHDFIEKHYFLQRIKTRLTKYIALFKQASQVYSTDWRLLATIAYQESHWNSDARSYTGVRGLMMLTQATAKQVGITNRIEPKQSILGGTKYLTIIDKKIPDRIQSPDRLWFTLAAYNVGYGHVEDARKLTQQNQGDPDDWTQVKEYLKKLSKPEWYNKTKHGHARGSEPVYYVEQIRRYYDTLKLYLYYQKSLNLD